MIIFRFVGFHFNVFFKVEQAKSNAIPEDEEGSLVKLSCHDSGIDIRDPNSVVPVVQPLPSKKVYSDADIVLSSDWVPPVTIAPVNVTGSTLDADASINGRKKASSVSFSLDSSAEEVEKDDEHKDDDKQETRKNKVNKRQFSLSQSKTVSFNLPFFYFSL